MALKQTVLNAKELLNNGRPSGVSRGTLEKETLPASAPSYQPSCSGTTDPDDKPLKESSALSFHLMKEQPDFPANITYLITENSERPSRILREYGNRNVKIP